MTDEEILLIMRLGNGMPINNNPIFHYTSPKGFEGIIGDNIRLWFTRYDCLNDIQEGINVLSIYQKVCDSLKEKEINEEVYNNIIDIKIENNDYCFYENRDYLQGKEEEGNYYLCCFSNDGDSIPMWNYYLKNNEYKGFSLEIDYLEFNSIKNDKWGELLSHIKIYEVIYDDRQKEKILREKVLEAVKIFHKNKDLIFYLKSLLRNYKLIFKHKAFESEKEIRACIFIPNSKKHILSYRMENGLIKPYVELEFKKNVLCSITLAPSIKDDLSKTTLDEYMKQKGYDNVLIRKSIIPIRI